MRSLLKLSGSPVGPPAKIPFCVPMLRIYATDPTRQKSPLAAQAIFYRYRTAVNREGLMSPAQQRRGRRGDAAHAIMRNVAGTFLPSVSPRQSVPVRSEFTPPVAKLGPHVAPPRMKFPPEISFRPEYRSNNIIIAEHGSWNWQQCRGPRRMRVAAGTDGKKAKQSEFASGWIGADGKYRGQPSDVLKAGRPLMVVDDFTGSICRISYSR
jgi:hypothetical protein